MYVLTNNQTYISVGKDNKLCGCSDIGQALQLETYVKADNVLKNLPKPLQRLSYHIEQYEESMVTDWELTEQPTTEELIEALKIVERYYFHGIANRQSNESKLTELNGALQDIEHAIEFYKYNVFDGFKMYKKLKETRETRRKVKDELTILSFLKESFTENMLKTPPSNRIKGLQNRQYSPRVLDELFAKERNT